MKPRHIRIEGIEAFVPLTQGFEAVIDAADAHLVDCKNWCVDDLTSPSTLYASRRTLIDGRWVKERLHRVIIGSPIGMLVDHINGNGLDCRRNNLRLVTPQQNALNRRTWNRHGLKGIAEVQGGFTANITVDRRRQYLGFFATKEEAHAAYCAASATHHREYGRTA